MSDSGFSGLPPRTGIGDTSYPPSRAELKVQIIEIRGEAKVRKAKERMEGEIIGHDKDGRTRIRTDKGEITVRFQTKTPPVEGSRIELEIPAGNPPRQATVQALPEKPPATNQQQPAQNIQERPPAAPLTPETAKGLSGDNIAPVTKNIRLAPLTPDSVIRLIPYSGTVIQNPVFAETQSALPPVAHIGPFSDTTVPISMADADNKLQFPVQNLSHLLAQITVTPQPFIEQTVLSPLPANEDDKLLPFQTRIRLPSLGHANTLPPLTSLFTTNTEIRTESSQASLPRLPQHNIDARITAITGPSVLMSDTSPRNAPPSTPPIKAGENTGTIIGKTPDGLPVISILQAGTKPSEPLLYALQFNASNLPVGTAINFIPENKAALPQAVGNQTLAAQTPFSLLPFISGGTWPAFEELAQTIQHLNPQALQTMAQTAPNPGNPARMASAILFFVAAVRGGDINSWLGDKTLNLLRKAGKGELLERLSRDVSGLSRATSEPISQDWRTLSLPLYWNGDIHKLQLYYRHDHPSKQNEDKDKTLTGTRFIFDLELSRMGAVQLDGLHRPQTDGNGRLDLVLRTMQKISPDMQKKMRLTYINALEQAGVAGELLFQDNPERFITIKPEKNAHETMI